jgi:hypothetical protein
MIQRGSDTSFTNLWSLLLYIQSLLHYIENAQENKKNTILSYNIAENSKRVKRNGLLFEYLVSYIVSNVKPLIQLKAKELMIVITNYVCLYDMINVIIT